MTTPVTTIVAISRQMGAGGAYVGQGIARRLNVRYVDREILEEAAKVLGRDDREVESLEERVTSVWARMAGALSWGAPEAPYVPPPVPTVMEEDVFAVEAEIIRQIAGREDAVIVGRGAAWVLREHPRLLSVFLHAPEEERTERVRQAYGLEAGPARDLVRRSDQQRGRFLQSLHGGEWIEPSHYHLCLDTSAIGIEETIEVLASLVERRRRA
ncbi:MAG TPA: cytidylate kinase-like family protein [Vicinamibacterales bacterium]